MQVLERTIQQRRARLNCESLLAFNGVDQYASAGVNENVFGAVDYDRDFAVSFLYQANDRISTGQNEWLISFGTLVRGLNVYASNSATRLRFVLSRTNAETVEQYIDIQRGKLYHIVANWSAATQRFTVYRNASAVEDTLVQSGIITGSVNNQSTALLIATGSLATVSTRSASAYLNHIIFFNRTLTEAEILGIHHYGGYLPKSVHAACVAHYVADREGLTMWDVVEQYNYLKEQLQKYLSEDLSNFSTTASPGDSGISYNAVDDRLIFNAPDNNTISSSSSVGVEPYRRGNKYRVEVDVENYISGQLEVRLNSRMAQNKNINNGTIIYPFTQDRYDNELVGGSPVFVSRGQGKFDVTGFRIIPLTEPVLDAYPATLQNFTDAEVGIPNQSTNTAYLDFYNRTPII